MSQGQDRPTQQNGENGGLVRNLTLKLTVHSKMDPCGFPALILPTLRPETPRSGVLPLEAEAGLAQAWEPQTSLNPELAPGGLVSFGLTL